ncbi:MAG: hypothetical protein EXS37_06150 [Opitutus sp.]|nr:hypothetical protein [Opitutus sp.]
MSAAEPNQSTPSATSGELPLAERIALAREILTLPRFRALCFWNWPEVIDVTEETLPGIARALQVHGGRNGFQLGAKLSPTPQSRKKYFDFSAKTETPRAT